MSSVPPNVFIRSPALWTLYALLGLYAYLQNAIGPAVPFLIAEFHLNYTFAALHMSAYAVGMMVAGVTAPWFIRRLGFQATQNNQYEYKSPSVQTLICRSRREEAQTSFHRY